MSGKGSVPRPLSVPKEIFDQSFERIFGRPSSGSTEINGFCPDCYKPLYTAHIHTCSPRTKDKK